VVAALAVLMLAGGAAADASWNATVNGTEVTVTYGGSGLASDPYEISNVTELQAIGHNDTTASFSYILTTDIDASQTNSWNGGLGFAPIANFSGNLSGANNAIAGLYIDRENDDRVALIRETTSPDITVDNLDLRELIFLGGASVGGLIAVTEPGSSVVIENVTINGSITGPGKFGGDSEGVGGIIGSYPGGASVTISVEISTSKFDGKIILVDNSQSIGGIVGHVGFVDTNAGSNFEIRNTSVTAEGLKTQQDLVIRCYRIWA